MHTGGEPLRIPIEGIPPLPGHSVLDLRRFFQSRLDHIRRSIIFEPRGHADMYAAIICRPFTKGADFSTFFLHNEGYSTMCGHAIIALSKFVIESGLIRKEEEHPELLIDAPPGLIRSKVHMKDGKVVQSSFLNVPSFVLLSDQSIEVEGIGKVQFDVAYGGAFYALVDADELGISMASENVHQLIDWGRRIKHAIMDVHSIDHPFEEDLSFLYGTIFTGKSDKPKYHSKNVCIFADGEVDRSSTGSGVSARAALHFSRGELKEGEEILIESILGSTMSVEVKEQVSYGPHEAVIPKVSGTAHFCGEFEHWVDPNDPLKDGFILR